MAGPELIPGHTADVGGIPVRRLLPRAVRRTVGPWCFVDHAGPLDVTDGTMQVGPAPPHRTAHRHLDARRRARAPRQPR